MSFLNKLFGKKEKESLDKGLKKSKNGLKKIIKAIVMARKRVFLRKLIKINT